MLLGSSCASALWTFGATRLLLHNRGLCVCPKQITSPPWRQRCAQSAGRRSPADPPSSNRVSVGVPCTRIIVGLDAWPPAGLISTRKGSAAR
jgi:hypothetical protein